MGFDDISMHTRWLNNQVFRGIPIEDANDMGGGHEKR